MDKQYYYVLYTTLLADMPKDTRNMYANTTLTDYGDYWEIRISGPTKSGYDYAEDVNRRQGVVKSGPNKGKVNYQWVERTIKQVSHLFGKEVDWKL